MSSPADADDAILAQNRLSSPSTGLDVDLEKGLINNEAQAEIKPISAPAAAASPSSALSKPLPLSLTIPTSPIVDLGPERFNTLDISDAKPNPTALRPGTPSTYDARAQPQQLPAATTAPYGPAPKAGVDPPPDPQNDIPVTLDQYMPFWKAYNDDADAQDAEIVESLGNDLDGLLIFAGLFSASNVAFIVEAYKELRKDNVDTTNDLLRIIIRNQVNPSHPVTDNTTVFEIEGRAVRVNALFFASLSCSLFTAFGAVLGKQWLNHYKREGKRMTLAERGRERQKKFIGLEFWHLEQVVETLPTLLQLSLFLFLGALIDFLWPLNRTTASVIAALSVVTFGFYIITTTIAALYPSAPFQTRFSGVIRDAGRLTLEHTELGLGWVRAATTSIHSNASTTWFKFSSFFSEHIFSPMATIIPIPLHSPSDLFTSFLDQARLFTNRFTIHCTMVINFIWTKLREGYNQLRSLFRPRPLRAPPAGADEISENEKYTTPEAIGNTAQDAASQRSPRSQIAAIASEPRTDEIKHDDLGHLLRDSIQNAVNTAYSKAANGFTFLRSLFQRSPGQAEQAESSEESSQDALSRECISWLLTTSSVDQTQSLAATAALMLPESIWTKITDLQQVSKVLKLVLRARAFESGVILSVPVDILRAVLEPVQVLVKRWDRVNDLVLPTLLDNDAFITAFERTLWKVVRAYPKDTKAAVWVMGIMDMLGFTSEPRQRDLDIVYQCIMEPVTPHKFLQLVLGSAILLESSMEFTSMKDLLKLEVETYEIADILRPFHASVLLIEENKFIRLVHHSARSFFSDFNRCRDERFQINSTLRQTDLALKCLSRMTESLRKHIIGLEDPVIMNENITDLDSRLAVVGVTESVQYACRHWATHLQFATTRNQKLNDSFKLFCETGLLPWLEVMSLLRQYDEALAALRHAETWIQNRDPSDEVASLLRDMSCFATTYQNVIMGNAAAIYSIALPLSYPSQLYDRYHDEGPWLKIPLRSPVNSWTSVFRIISPNAGEVNDVAITHDSKYIVSGLDDYSARLYALGSGACIKTYEGHSSYVQSVSLSPNNRLLASGSYDRTMRIWDTKTGVSKSTLEGHTYIVFATDFSPDSMYIVTGGGDRTVRLWDAKSGSLVATMEGHEDYVRSANFSPNGRMILSASDDSTIRLWDVTHHMSIATLEGHSGYVYSAVFSPNNQLIASGGMDKTVRIWNAESHSLIHTLKGHDEYVHCVAFSSDSKYVVSSSGDCTIRIWDVQEGSIQRVLEGHRNATRTVMFTPDQMYIVSGSADSYIRVWNWSDREGNPISSVPTHSSRINLIEFSPDGRIVASAGGGGEVHLWDVVNMAHITELKGASELINSPTSLSVSSDSRYVTLSSGEKSVKWDMTTHEVVPPPPSPEVSPHNSPQQSPHQEMNEDNKEQTVQYHIGMTYGTIYAYRVDPNEGTRQKMLCSDSPVTNVSASSGYGYFLALGTTGGYVTILDFSSIISFESLFSSEGESAEPPQQ